ncbi:MAG: hypothetical protein QNK42_09685 [Pseudodonghicola sp.]|nr:hypothetical protein [Pseudodonghicola sp.]
MEDTLAAFADYARDPDCKPGQKQLVDLSKITGYEPDFTKMMQVQANKADVFVAEGAETLMVYYAPNKLTQDLARLALRSWEPFDYIVALVQEDDAQALELLGQPERSLDALWALAPEA